MRRLPHWSSAHCFWSHRCLRHRCLRHLDLIEKRNLWQRWKTSKSSPGKERIDAELDAFWRDHFSDQRPGATTSKLKHKAEVPSRDHLGAWRQENKSQDSYASRIEFRWLHAVLPQRRRPGAKNILIGTSKASVSSQNRLSLGRPMRCKIVVVSDPQKATRHKMRQIATFLYFSLVCLGLSNGACCKTVKGHALLSLRSALSRKPNLEQSQKL